MILFISNSGESLPIAYRMNQHEGARATVYLHHKDYRENGRGLVPTIGIRELKGAVKKASHVVFDITRINEGTVNDRAMLQLFGLPKTSKTVFGPVAEKIAKERPVIGAARWAEEIEFNRQAGVRLAQQAGFSIPKTHSFQSPEQAIAFLRKNRQQYVLKPDNNADLDLTYVEKYTGELLDKFAADLKGRLKGSFVLQEKVEGTEISSEAWWTGKTFLNWNHTIEEKRMMNSNLGPSIGSQANCVWMEPDSMIKPYFERLQKPLRASGYVGPVDVNCIIKDGKPYFLEWSCRFGWDALYCLLTLLETDITDFLTRGFQGKFSPGFACSQRVTIPPFPYDAPELLKKYAEGVPIREDAGSFWALDVRQGKGDLLECAGADGIVGVVAEKDTTIQGAYNRVFSKAGSLRVGAYLQYRTDSAKPAERRYEDFYGNRRKEGRERPEKKEGIGPEVRPGSGLQPDTSLPV